ncbi:hypothetical protein FWG95_04250, partial [Candidatus Saccharibacteria bacterium]|nr:hypothetical protein [Candidatus Saccharibacteria bacterium]
MFDIPREIFGIITIVISSLIYIPMIVSTIKGKIKPHPISWAIAGLTSLISGLIFLFNDAGPGGWVPIYNAGLSFILTAVSFHFYRKSARITRQDMLFFFLAILSLILWLLSRDLAAISVVLLQVTTVLGFVPTFTKTWKHPRSESYYIWNLFNLVSIFGLAATVNLDFVNSF